MGVKALFGGLRKKLLRVLLGKELYTRLCSDQLRGELNRGFDNINYRLDSMQNEFRKLLFDARCGQFFELPYLREGGDDKPRFIVTLTSYGSRIFSTLPGALYSIFTQSVLPDKIVLYLAYGEAVPRKLKQLEEHGLEIHFCDDIKSYKKLIPSLKEFPNDVLITADDDCYYPRNWFLRLKDAYMKDPSKIYCHRAHEITFDADGAMLPYRSWKSCAASPQTPQEKIFPTGAGGILYPPRSLHPDVINESLFSVLCPSNDDIWFWAMARLQGTLFGVLKDGYAAFLDMQYDAEETPLWHGNVLADKNDEQIAAVLARYPAAGVGVCGTAGAR